MRMKTKIIGKIATKADVILCKNRRRLNDESIPDEREGLTWSKTCSKIEMFVSC
jgi:hypothetical protein